MARMQLANNRPTEAGQMKPSTRSPSGSGVSDGARTRDVSLHHNQYSLRVSDGARTRDILDHNQVLYQLSYTHHRRAGARSFHLAQPRQSTRRPPASRTAWAAA